MGRTLVPVAWVRTRAMHNLEGRFHHAQPCSFPVLNISSRSQNTRELSERGEKQLNTFKSDGVYMKTHSLFLFRYCLYLYTLSNACFLEDSCFSAEACSHCNFQRPLQNVLNGE